MLCLMDLQNRFSLLCLWLSLQIRTLTQPSLALPGNILNFNVGASVDLNVPRSFWSRLAGKYGNIFFWREQVKSRQHSFFQELLAPPGHGNGLWSSAYDMQITIKGQVLTTFNAWSTALASSYLSVDFHFGLEYVNIYYSDLTRVLPKSQSRGVKCVCFSFFSLCEH